jgi:hypothetical protein
MMESLALHKLDTDLSSGLNNTVPKDEISRLFDKRRKYLLSKHSFISKLYYQKWTVTTWSKQLQFASVIKQAISFVRKLLLIPIKTDVPDLMA